MIRENENTFFGALKAGYDLASEATAVAAYKKESTVYKNLQKAVLTYQLSLAGRDDTTSDMLKLGEELRNAMTFSEMVHAIDQSMINELTPIQRFGVKALFYVGGFFSNEANVAHYALQLKIDVINHAVEKGFSNQIRPQLSYVRTV